MKVLSRTLFPEEPDRMMRWSALASGLTLVPLLPAGAFLGFGLLYSFLFTLHIAVLLLTCLCAIHSLIALCARRSLPAIVLGVYLLLLIPLLGGLCTLPVTSTDALIHHLAVPKWWVQAGHISEISWHEWSYYPMLLNLAYAGLISWGVGSGFALYHLAFFVILLGLMASFKDATEDNQLPIVAVLAAATLPVFIRLAQVPLVDLGLATFCLLAILHLQAFYGQGRNAELIGAGIALGLAMSTKYNGMLFAALFFGATFLLAVTKRLRAGELVSLSLAAVSVVSPWLLKNLLWTGNPIYPLMRSLLGGPSVPTPGAPRSLAPLLHRVAVYGESYFDLLLLPLRIFLTGEDRSPALFDGSLTPLLLLGVFAVAAKQDSVRKMVAGWLSVVYILVALVVSPARVRYLVPALPALCLQTQFVASLLTRGLRASTRTGIYLAITLILVGNAAAYIAGSIMTAPVRGFLRGEISHRDYIALHNPEYPLIEEINRQLGPESRVYLLGTGNSFYYFERPVLSRGYYSVNEVISWLRSGTKAAGLAERFLALGISHIMVHGGRLGKNLQAVLTPEELDAWNDFSKERLQGIAAAGEYSLWKIHSSSGAESGG